MLHDKSRLSLLIAKVLVADEYLLSNENTSINNPSHRTKTWYNVIHLIDNLEKLSFEQMRKHPSLWTEEECYDYFLEWAEIVCPKFALQKAKLSPKSKKERELHNANVVLVSKKLEKFTVTGLFSNIEYREMTTGLMIACSFLNKLSITPKKVTPLLFTSKELQIRRFARILKPW